MKSLTSFFVLVAILVVVALTSSSSSVQATPSTTPTVGIQLIQDYIKSLKLPPPLPAKTYERSAVVNSADVCPYNMSNPTSYLSFVYEVLGPLMSQTNWTGRCNVWPSMQPCVEPFLASLGASSANKNKTEATLNLYGQFCQKMGDTYCYVSADILVNRDACYYQTPQKGTGCDKEACYVSASGTSCIPRATPDYFGVYCSACFPKIRSVLISYYQLVSTNVTAGSSSSTSGSDSGKSTTQGTDFGIILTDAGFAATDSRVAFLCTPGCSTSMNPFFSQPSYSETFSRLLFDFSAGASSFLTGNDIANINSLSSSVCAGSSDSALPCFRRFVATWLNSNRVLSSFFQQTCTDGRNASKATCTMEDNSMRARVAWWQGDLAATKASLCEQKGAAGVAASTCLGVPSATYAVASTNECFKQAFDASATIGTACMTNITDTLTSWGCCVQTLINTADPELNPAVKTWVTNYINTKILDKKNEMKCVVDPSAAYVFNRQIGMRLTTLPYSAVENNKTLSALLSAAVLADIAAAIGASALNFGSGAVQITRAPSGVSSEEETAGAFYPNVKSVPASDQTVVIVLLTATSTSDIQYLQTSYNTWITGSSPSSPEINTVLYNEGYGSSVGSSSVAAYSVPDTPAPSGSPGTNSPGGSPSGSPSGSKDGVIAGAVIAGLLGIGIVVFVVYRVSRKRAEGGTGTRASERGSEIGDYAEVQ